MLGMTSILDDVHQQFSGRTPIDQSLINQAFQTDGLDLFVERYGHLINAFRAVRRAHLTLWPCHDRMLDSGVLLESNLRRLRPLASIWRPNRVGLSLVFSVSVVCK